MTTTKTVIANTLSSSLSTIYTNSTGSDAILKALNVTGTGDPSVVNMTPSADQWSFFGSSYNITVPYADGASYGFGVPIIIKLSTDRLMLIWLPHYMHQGGQNDFMGGGLIHTQIVEYQTDKYVAGPIVNVILPTQSFSAATYSLRSIPSGLGATYGQPCMKGVALSSTKVAIAYRQGSVFRLMRLPITGNIVDVSNIASLDLTGASYFNTTTSGAFDIRHVAGNANKVIVGGYSTTNFLVQAYNIPDTGAISNATTATSTGITAALQPFAIGNLNKTATSNITYYAAVGGSSATAGSIILMSYNSSTDVLATVGAAASISGSTQWAGFEVGCVSTGTSVNGVVAATSTGATTTVTFYRQTSSTAASGTSATLTLQSSLARSIQTVHNWGDERVVFTGDTMIVSYDSAGTSSTLLPTTLTTSNVRHYGLFYPFDSRPLQNYYDPASIRADSVPQYLARVGTTSTTDVGDFDFTGNYFPWGYDYGIGYAWSNAANCWFAISGGRIYSLSSTGKVLDEVSLFSLSSTFNYLYQSRQITVTQSGKIIFIVDYGFNTGATTYDIVTAWNNYSSATLIGASTLPVTSPYGLSKTALASPQQTFTNGFLPVSLVSFTDYSGTERAIAIYLAVVGTVATHYTLWTDNSWISTFAATSMGTTTTSTHNVGHRVNLRLLQDTPCSAAFPQGRWRLIGYSGTNSQANMYSIYLTDPYAPSSFGSLGASVSLFSATHGYAFYHSVGDNYNVAASFDPTAGFNKVRIFASSRGRLSLGTRGWYPVANVPNSQYVSVETSKFNYSVAAHNTSGANNVGRVYVFTDASLNNPVATITSGNGTAVWTHTMPNKLSVAAFSANTTANIGNTYTTHSMPDTLKFYAAVTDGSNTFYINNGQALASNGFFRSNDTYALPNGYSLRLSTEVSNNFSAMATIIEEV